MKGCPVFMARHREFLLTSLKNGRMIAGREARNVPGSGRENNMMERKTMAKRSKTCLIF